MPDKSAASDWPLLGRSTELSRLSDCAKSAHAGQARLVVVRGPAGVGRTSLLAAVRRDVLRHDEFLVLHATCPETGGGTAYGAVRALFAPMEVAGAAEDANAPHRARTGAKWAREALSASRSAGAHMTRLMHYQVLYGLFWLAAEVMTEQPLAIVLDDAQWCDELSLRWLEFLLRRADRLPLLVVLGQRTDTPGRAQEILAGVLAEPRAEIVDLPPLAPAEVAELAEIALDDRLDPLFVRSCVDVSRGNPRLLRRLLEEVTRSGVGTDATGAEAVARIGGAVVVESALDRLDEQPESVRAVATAVAVLDGTSEDVGSRPLGELAGVPSRQVSEALAALRRIDVLLPGSLDFVHESLPAGVIGRIAVDELERLRSRTARLLNDAGSPAEDVARHLMPLSDLPESWMARALVEAAASAERRHAHEEAVCYLRRAVELGRDSTARPHLRVDLARSLAKSDPVAALGELGIAISESADPRIRAVIAAEFGRVSLVAGRAPEGARVVTAVSNELRLLVGDRPEPADRELLALAEWVLLLTSAEERSTVGVARAKVRTMTPPSGHSPRERQVLGVMAALAADECHPVDRVVDWATRATRVLPDTGDWAILNAARALRLADEVDASLAAYGWISGRHGDPVSSAHVLALAGRAHVHYSIGDLHAAASGAERALAERGAGQARTALPEIVRALAFAAQGEPAMAETLLDLVAQPRLEDAVGDWHPYLMARASARLAAGDVEGALHHLFSCGHSLVECGISNPVVAPWWVDAVSILTGLGRMAEARRVVEEGQDLVRRWPTPRAIGLGLMVEGIAGTGTGAVEVLGEAVRVLATSPAQLDLAHAQRWLGAALLRVEDAGAARKHLRASMDQATLCGATALARSAAELHTAAGGRRRQVGWSIVDNLTEAERRVAAIAVQGRSNKEIAEALFVTVRTVEMHLTNIYRKLGISRRSALAEMLPDDVAPEQRRRPPARPVETSDGGHCAIPTVAGRG